MRVGRERETGALKLAARRSEANTDDRVAASSDSSCGSCKYAAEAAQLRDVVDLVAERSNGGLGFDGAGIQA